MPHDQTNSSRAFSAPPARTIGPVAMDEAAARSTFGTLPAYFARAVAADAKAHPWRYATHAVGLALPFTGIPVLADGLITAGEALVNAYDLQKEAHNP